MKKLILSVLLVLNPFASVDYSRAAPRELIRTEFGIGVGGDVLKETGNAAIVTILPQREDGGFPPIHQLLPNGLFANRILTPEDIGETFVADRQTDPSFDFVTNSFTSGLADLFTVCSQFVPSSGITGAGCTGYPRSGFPSTDVRGLVIDSWLLTVNSLNISVRDFGSRPFGPSGLITELHGSVTVAVNVIPEPGTAILLSTGISLVILQHRLRRRSVNM